MVTSAPGQDGDPQLQALTTLAGWRQFAAGMPAVPQLLDGQVWQGLDEEKRLAYDEDRIVHHSRLLIVQTPAIRDVITTGRRLAHLNKAAHYGRCGLIVSGPARTGKTTAITQLGKTIEVIHRRRHPRSGGDIPVGSFSQGQQWITLIAALEGSLRLHRHRPGTLSQLGGYLHQRTHGMIGSLLWLIRSAAIQAVIDGTEKITRKDLDAIRVDIASQAARPRPRSTP